MKRTLFFSVCFSLICINIKAQVTQINNNNSLHVTVPLNDNATIVVSDDDATIWVTDATKPGTIQLSPDIVFEDDWALLSGKLIFKGNTGTTGSELYITDGTIAGTTLLKDIVSGTTGSTPSNLVLMNGFIYFTAQTAPEGRELWRTNGTDAGTTLVKDITPGTGDTFDSDETEIFSSGTYLLFPGNTATAGVELYKSDGTSAGTDVLKDINPLIPSSNPRLFYKYNNMVLFLATDEDHGEEIWKTDGTSGNTVMLKDINEGPENSTSFELVPGFDASIFLSFHLFNNKLYFTATDGGSHGQIWVTDGLEANTVLLKDVAPDAELPIIFLIDAVNLPNKFIFPLSDGTNAQLWESDGTESGTKVFKDFTAASGELPAILIPYSINFAAQTATQTLFQGDKFFFIASTDDDGRELWISDGTLANTTMVKDINPGAESGMGDNLSYLYTNTELFFAADDGTTGNELWRTNGTDAGTSLVFDINPEDGSSDPELSFITNVNKIIFSATDGDDANLTDLYVLDGSFSPLPIKLGDFTVTLKASDGLLQWSTLQEVNTKDFTVQRSFDGQHFENIGVVPALGTTYTKHSYSFNDAGIANKGKDVVYYRLRTSDKDGKIDQTNIILLKLISAKWDVRLLANPVQDHPKLLLSGVRGKVQLSIRDLNGKMVYTNSIQNANGQFSLLTNLQKGMYILTVETNNEQKVLKFIKQ
jgi:ELWxxDGT repeat protein